MRRGWTLIELLIALTILAILAALSYPVMSGVRANGRQAVCVSQLAQIGQALRMYAADASGRLPPADLGVPGGRWSYPEGNRLNIMWWDVLEPYVNNPQQVFICPEWGGNAPNYKMNCFVEMRRTGQLQDDIVLAMDGKMTDPNDPNEKLGSCTGQPSLFVDYRHNGAANFVFVDGRVKRLTLQQISDPMHWELQPSRLRAR